MIAVVLAVLCHAALCALCVLVERVSGVPAPLVWLAYWTLGSMALVHFDWSCAWLRTTRLSGALRRDIAAVRFTESATERLGALRTELARGKQAIFAIEPHGYACISVALLFAGYGSTPRSLPHTIGASAAAKLRVVSHWLALAIPFIRELYAVFGVVDSTRATVFAELARGNHVLLIPSGMPGKELGALRDAPHNVVDVVRRPDTRLGFVYAAVRFSALLVPVLALDENHAYATCGPSFAPWFLQLVVGRFLVAPFWRRTPMRVAVGEPIDVGSTHWTDRAAIHRLAERYYAALDALAREHGATLVLHGGSADDSKARSE